MDFPPDKPDSKAFAVCEILPNNMQALFDVRTNAFEAGLISDEGSITYDGHKYLEQFDFTSESSNQAFVAMWFDPTLSAILFDSAIEPAVRRAGYKAFRVDRKEHSNRIDDEIVGEIRRSRFVIADFTCPIHKIEKTDVAEHRGGVYYEAGLAHGLGLPVIWTCDSGIINFIHFDTRQYNHLLWEHDKLEEFAIALERRIRAVVGQGPLV